jgi:8-oxo-dGTP pyrophosphatase MutT (NUDIX family)
MREWKIESVETLVAHRLLRVLRQTLETGGDRREAIVFESADWVNVIPVCDDGQVILVRQWRYGTAGPSLEIPGGLVDPGETPRDTALRELEEETGYRAGSIERLAELSPNPALFTNRISFWLATDLTHVTDDPQGDGEEEIEVVTASLDEIPQLAANGEITHALNLCAFYFLGLRSPKVDPQT